MSEKEPIDPAAFLDLFNSFNSNINFNVRLFQAMRHHDPERKLERFTKPHALACLFVSIMMLRSGHDPGLLDGGSEVLENAAKVNFKGPRSLITPERLVPLES